MPIRSKDTLGEAQALYERMQNEAITLEAVGGGLSRENLNFTHLLKLVQQDPDSAQLAVQMLGQPPADASEAERKRARQHGVWLLMAYIAFVGPRTENLKFIRMMVPDLYEAAFSALHKQFGR